MIDLTFFMFDIYSLTTPPAPKRHPNISSTLKRGRRLTEKIKILYKSFIAALVVFFVDEIYYAFVLSPRMMAVVWRSRAKNITHIAIIQ